MLQGSHPRQVAYVADAVDALPPRAANANDDTADQKYGEMSQRQLPIILALGTTQTLAWASSYYLPALLADPMARDLGISSNWVATPVGSVTKPLHLPTPKERSTTTAGQPADMPEVWSTGSRITRSG